MSNCSDQIAIGGDLRPNFQFTTIAGLVTAYITYAGRDSLHVPTDLGTIRWNLAGADGSARPAGGYRTMAFQLLPPGWHAAESARYAGPN